jgi:hypothetical protein
MYTVRFNLGRGKNYMKWRVYDKEAQKAEYYDSEEFSLSMIDCRLINRRSTADKIYKGANKSVCAWIECREVQVYECQPQLEEIATEIKYNPRVKPYWIIEDWNADNYVFIKLHTSGKRIWRY